MSANFDAVVVGSGPNGLGCAIELQRAGKKVKLFEGQPTFGGGARSAALTLPGFTHDLCSAIHPLAASSPFFHRSSSSGAFSRIAIDASGGSSASAQGAVFFTCSKRSFGAIPTGFRPA